MRAAIVPLLVLVTAGCKERPPHQWIGLDRSAAACTYDETPVHWQRSTCIAAGRRYTCVLGDDDHTWQCAELALGSAATPISAPAPAERAE